MDAIQFNPQATEGTYILDEHTTEYGNISLDGSPYGTISNCFIYTVQRTENGRRIGFIDHYINRETGIVTTVRLVSLTGFKVRQEPLLQFTSPPLPLFKTPIFDTKKWKEILSGYDEYSFSIPIFIQIDEDKDVQISHNGRDTVHLMYGAGEKEVFLNECISTFFDDENRLQGVKFFSPEYVPELLRRMGLKITG
jgi:hypothetical protein